MDRQYIVTGANGHLGSTIIRILQQNHQKVRWLVLPNETGKLKGDITYYQGDVRDIESIRPIFLHTWGDEVIVIHTAGIIDISDEMTEAMYDVNVNGTKNVIALCQEYGVKRLVYVSSVHAIPEKNAFQVLQEVQEFSADAVVGGYAKTKAEATQAVLQAAKEGLDAVVVQPSGILGPYDTASNHLVQLVVDYAEGRLPACVAGGYDFVDVRDVAKGCLSAVDHGKKGECYILSNRHYEVKDLLEMIRSMQKTRKVPTLPMWMAKAAEPFLRWYAKIKHRRPLYTRYSLYTLRSNDRFSHDKATKELNYRPRDLYQTIRDTIAWLHKKPVSIS